ncbi:NADH dehydrogenase FAD-containing subunit [Allocatelliglobosispora scoriae]|uniref:NADH dehydrogenase FAD-containing subunit n=1 Tax=Allocatelliglobosispora scoriae TaxID=643052 RepID=A0A841BMG3_9ACTN|nr:FAD/NAD(P)-binding oxidoreductase [Allocatelliglobosispora scoriae]MBB5868163.1 NADH dehydrogenase FAD-containing subunit [Allocatelliglobosispora scoriae]
MQTSSQRPTVAIIGGGYGGINAAKALDEHAEVVLIDPSDAFQHSVAALRALVDPAVLPRTFLPYDRLLAHGTVLRDRAVEVDSERVVLASGQVLTPDFVILATGSAYPFPGKADRDGREAAIERYRAVYGDLDRAERVLLVGAGAVGLELAGEIASFWPDKQVTLLDLAEEILPGPFDPELRVELRRQLDALGVRLLLGSPLTKLPSPAPGTLAAFTVETDAGTEIEADLWLPCFGGVPATGYLRGDLVGARNADGYLAVTAELHLPGHERIYAIGDISAADADKASAAGRQAEVVVANIKAQLAGDAERKTYAAGPASIILPLGPTGGAGQFPGREGVLTAEFVSELKGKDMMIGRYAAIMNADQH